MKAIAILAAAVVAAAGVLAVLLPHRELSTRIEIAAPPSRVWAVLLDTGSYDKWNPNMRLVGSLVPGATIQTSGRVRRGTLRPVVLLCGSTMSGDAAE